ncbi:MAG: glycosyltransferase family 2 protein [Bacteroidaceae bacterium]|nr:glycosyltransferase family 2 protein [Bacteroidaceae bacterium]
MTTAIIILNWNGAKDTIECLASLSEINSSYYVVLVDNQSEDDSISQIISYLHASDTAYRHLKTAERLTSAPVNHECILYEAGENLGFARGNNAGIRLLSDFAPERYLLLNNDTIVEPDFLDRLEEFHASHPEYDALTPLICYNEPRTLVWNAGGRQFLGMRKYYYAKEPVSAIREKEYIDITFLTGCALYLTPEALEDGVPLTERFFFGEEDFEFCLRMNQSKRKMACVLTSRIYHKVSASTAGKSSIGKHYIHYLNRFIDMRLHYSLPAYISWALAYIPYIQLLLLRGRHGAWNAMVMPWRVFSRSFRQDCVSQEDFIKALRG